MARLHMKFRNIHRKVRDAGEVLFAAKPWAGSDEDKQSKFERFLSTASEAYGIPTPTLAVIPDADVSGLVAPNTIVLAKYSVTSLFHSFRAHMQYMGACDVAMYNAADAQAWACSLFYTLRPISFRRAVRAGTVWGVHAEDLLTSASLAARQDEVDEAFAGLIAAGFSETEVEDAEDESSEATHTAGTYSNPNVDADRTYSRPEAAEMLGVSVSTVRNMINDGRLSSVTEGRRSLVTGESLARLVPTSEVSE